MYYITYKRKSQHKKAHLRRQGQVRLKRDYFDTQYGIMTEKDYKVAELYAGRAKEKYIKKEQRKAKHSK